MERRSTHTERGPPAATGAITVDSMKQHLAGVLIGFRAGDPTAAAPAAAMPAPSVPPPAGMRTFDLRRMTMAQLHAEAAKTRPKDVFAGLLPKPPGVPPDRRAYLTGHGPGETLDEEPVSQQQQQQQQAPKQERQAAVKQEPAANGQEQKQRQKQDSQRQQQTAQMAAGQAPKQAQSQQAKRQHGDKQQQQIGKHTGQQQQQQQQADGRQQQQQADGRQQQAQRQPAKRQKTGGSSGQMPAQHEHLAEEPATAANPAAGSGLLAQVASLPNSESAFATMTAMLAMPSAAAASAKPRDDQIVAVLSRCLPLNHAPARAGSNGGSSGDGGGKRGRSSEAGRPQAAPAPIPWEQLGMASSGPRMAGLECDLRCLWQLAYHEQGGFDSVNAAGGWDGLARRLGGNPPADRVLALSQMIKEWYRRWLLPLEQHLRKQQKEGPMADGGGGDGKAAACDAGAEDAGPAAAGSKR